MTNFINAENAQPVADIAMFVSITCLAVACICFVICIVLSELNSRERTILIVLCFVCALSDVFFCGLLFLDYLHSAYKIQPEVRGLNSVNKVVCTIAAALSLVLFVKSAQRAKKCGDLRVNE